MITRYTTGFHCQFKQWSYTGDILLSYLHKKEINHTHSERKNNIRKAAYHLLRNMMLN